jgi:hypothetical protein
MDQSVKMLTIDERKNSSFQAESLRNKAGKILWDWKVLVPLSRVQQCSHYRLVLSFHPYPLSPAKVPGGENRSGSKG